MSWIGFGNVVGMGLYTLKLNYPYFITQLAILHLHGDGRLGNYSENERKMDRTNK